MCKDSYFYKLNQVNVSGKTEKKGNLTYLSWCWAWGELKKEHPTANYKVYEHPENYCNYFHDGNTAWVKVSVTVEEIEHIEYLPIMDMRNKSLKVESITSFDVNKAIQRALTKAIARHGLGLYIYAGEDLPEESEEQKAEEFNKLQSEVAKLKTVEDVRKFYTANKGKYKDTILLSVTKQKADELKVVV